MEELYFDEVVDKIQDIYSNIFLIALKKKLNIGTIVDTVAQEIEEYKENEDDFIPQGIEGLLFVTSAARMMDYSLFDVMYLSNEEKCRIIQGIIDEIDTSDISDYNLDKDDTYFVYDYYLEDIDGTEVDYELRFDYDNILVSVTVEAYIDGKYGFESDLFPSSLKIWHEANIGIYFSVKEIIDDLIQREATDIDYKDFFIHSDKRGCQHKYIKVMATVPIFSNREVKTISFEADYCAECGVYYIPESVYQNKILLSGRLLCQVMSLDEYSEYKREMSYNGELKPQSILNMIGYTVNAKDDLSDYERRTILQYAIESGIITKKLAIFYLQTFIRKSSPKKGLERAVQKWKSDLQWLYDFNKNGDIIYGVRRIIKDNNVRSFMNNPDEIDWPFK